MRKAIFRTECGVNIVLFFLRCGGGGACLLLTLKRISMRALMLCGSHHHGTMHIVICVSSSEARRFAFRSANKVMMSCSQMETSHHTQLIWLKRFWWVGERPYDIAKKKLGRMSGLSAGVGDLHI